MTEPRWLVLPTNELLKAFGAGHHKPGSGSASALLGLLSASLSKTVIILTASRHSDEDGVALIESQEPRLRDIEDQLAVDLEDDSEVWHRVVTERRARDAARAAGDDAARRRHARAALAYQREATELPLRMAALCAELAGIGLLAFDYGWSSVGGDAAVAVTAAVAAVAGCVAIVRLNLQAFRASAWKSDAARRAEDLHDQATRLHDELSRRVRAMPMGS